MQTLIIFFLLTCSLAAQSAPKGWDFASPSNRVAADFDGDGVQDIVAVLVPSSGEGYGLFAFLNGKKTARLLSINSDITAKSLILATSKAGVYKTACGRGLWDCAKGEPPRVTLKFTGIIIGESEQWSSLIYYNSKTHFFHTVALSD